MKTTKTATLLAVSLIFLLVACSEDIPKATIEKVEYKKPLSEMTCKEVEDAYADCDNVSSWINHIRNCREQYYPALWRCYGMREQPRTSSN